MRGLISFPKKNVDKKKTAKKLRQKNLAKKLEKKNLAQNKTKLQTQKKNVPGI